MIGKVSPATIHLQSTGLVGQIAERIEAGLSELRSFNDPLGVYARMPVDLDIH
jgi:hypothetical protein